MWLNYPWSIPVEIHSTKAIFPEEFDNRICSLRPPSLICVIHNNGTSLAEKLHGRRKALNAIKTIDNDDLKSLLL
jgi:hypothetical protein